jgi:hypothetical protein
MTVRAASWALASSGNEERTRRRGASCMAGMGWGTVERGVLASKACGSAQNVTVRNLWDWEVPGRGGSNPRLL